MIVALFNIEEFFLLIFSDAIHTISSQMASPVIGTYSPALLALWPESDKLLAALKNSSEAGGSKVQQYTFPVVKHEMAVLNGAAMDVNMDSIMALIKSGSLRQALHLTTKLLTNLGHRMGNPAPQLSPQSFEIWSCRFQLMMVLRLYTQLLEELIAFGELDAPDLYFQFHPAFAENKGSMVPFSLRLMHAEAASFSPTPYQSMGRIQRLEANTRKVIEMLNQQGNPPGNTPPAELDIWQQRLSVVSTMRARVLFRLKEFDKCFSAYEQMQKSTLLLDKQRAATVTAGLLRMAMHIGDAGRVDAYMEQLSNLCAPDSTEFVMCSCSKAIFDGDYARALTIVQEWKARNPEQAAATTAIPTLCNNEAVCLLYNGRAMECMQMLFNHVGSVNESLAQNLATVADLVSTNSLALKKNYLAKHEGEPAGDLFDPQTMRLG